ncbi:MAG: hypothetical protein GY913_35610 [Proteobacteria bacterium]|nr:hypothetical protein [Pseudomonadota bacterium]
MDESVCDGLDDDCDGQVDEGLLSTLYVDEDDDGWGTEVSEDRCPISEPGWSTQTGDCDDGDRTVSPDADEFCNGQDDDCDGQVDEGLEPPTWYADDDGDGYGDDAAVTETCVQPDGTADCGGDCDDEDATAHPGAFEACGDGLDNDCDGAIDDVSTCRISTTDGEEDLLLCTEPATWADARDAREADGWSMVVVDDEGEDALIAELTEWLDELIWVGLTDEAEEGVWLTVHDTTPPFYAWIASEPNNLIDDDHPGGQDCAAYNPGTLGWHDLFCDSQTAFACEQTEP